MNKITRLLITVFLCAGDVVCASGQSWTWLLKKEFSADNANNNVHNNLVFAKTDIPKFSQLIFSWNSFRPVKGHFTFFVQVRDAQTKKWHDWHKMIDWGRGIQRSYFNEAPSGTKYCHVRLEVPHKEYADGLRIKITSNNGADVSLIKSIAVNIVDLAKFKPESLDYLKSYPSVFIDDIPQRSQMQLDHPKGPEMCSPTSCSMLASYLAGSEIDPLFFAGNVYDSGLESYGSWPFNTAHAFEHTGGENIFTVTRLDSFKALYAKLHQGIPVVVSVRGALKGAPKEYNSGHLLVVVGWDNKTGHVLCHDPRFETDDSVLTRYDVDSFCSAWERSRRLAYVAEPAKSA